MNPATAPPLLHLAREHRVWTLLVAVTLGYAALAVMSFELFGAAGAGATFFPAAGLTVVALHRSRVAHWPAILAAIAVAETVVDLSYGVPAGLVLGFVLANSLEPLVAALLLRRLRVTVLAADFRVAARAGAAALLAGPAVGGAIGASAIALQASGGESAWLDDAWNWALGDALGVLVVAPILLALGAETPRAMERFFTWPGAVLGGAVIVFGIVMYSTTAPPAGYFALPILAFAVFRFPTLVVAIVAAALTGVSAAATAAGRGHWAATIGDTGSQLATQNVFWLVALLGTWVLTHEVRRRRALVAATAAVEERLEGAHIQVADERRQRRMSERRGQLLRTLAQSQGHEEVAQASFEFARGRFRATRVAIVDFSEISSVTPAATMVSEAGIEEVAIPGPAIRSLRSISESGRPQFLSEISVGAEDGDLMGWVRDGTLAVLPSGHDGIPAAVMLGWDRPRRVPDEERGELFSLAQLILASFDRVRRHATDRALAEAFEQTLFTDREPSHERVRVATRYLSGTALLEVGGDWYDVVSHDDGTVSLMIGDVVGKGLEAATTMGQLRLSASALVRQGSPGEALASLDMVASESDLATFATMAIVTIDPAKSTLHYAFAGHPPGLVRRPDGHAFLLDEATSPPLGIASDDPRPTARAEFSPGSAIALFTDGLVERRGEIIDVGLKRLRGAIYAGPPEDPEALADHLVQVALAGAEQRDDAALLCAFLPARASRGLDG